MFAKRYEGGKMI